MCSNSSSLFLVAALCIGFAFYFLASLSNFIQVDILCLVNEGIFRMKEKII